jgi:hypothetical protein
MRSQRALHVHGGSGFADFISEDLKTKSFEQASTWRFGNAGLR